MRIVRLNKKDCEQFVCKKHYSRKSSIFWAGFGLIIDGLIEGVVVYGQPSPPLQKHAFDKRDFKFYELSRLVIQTKRKNAASFLVAGSLRMLEKPCAVVSYADTEMGHSGIVYQSTNWIYTGSTVSHDHLYLLNGKRTHPMTLRDMGITNPKLWAKENKIQTVKPMPKHRYFYVLANSKKEKANMIKSLKYEIIHHYPKSEKTMYDDGPRINISFENTTQNGLW
jgi:hypothetical protein